MNSIIEKEKKLNLALTELKNLNLKNPDLQSSIENLNQNFLTQIKLHSIFFLFRL